MNKIIGGKQCAILWHVYDLKTSNVNPDVIYIVVAYIDAEYGKIEKMTIMRGKVHKYLRITIDQSSPSNIILSMIDYIGKMLDNITEYMKWESATPAAHHHLDIA